MDLLYISDFEVNLNDNDGTMEIRLEISKPENSSDQHISKKFIFTGFDKFKF